MWGGLALDNLQQKQEKTAEGFSFYTEKDALLARNEAKKIEFLESKLDYSNPTAILRVYEKAVQDRVFRTPVGLMFLKKLQTYLRGRHEIDPGAIAPIPLFHTYEEEIRAMDTPARVRVQPPKKKDQEKIGYRISVILNLLLVLAVLAMFWITINADQPNILNYEKALKNRYATWEQELTEREQNIRELERAIKVEEN